MDVSLFDYDLPPQSIAQEPAEPRDASKLLVLDRARSALEDARFSDLPRWLEPGDCVVVNESRVYPARLLGTLEGSGRAVELLMLRALDGIRWEALVRPGRRCGVGARVVLASGAAQAIVREHRPHGERVVEITAPWEVDELLERHGLPPCRPTSNGMTRRSPRIASATKLSTRRPRARWRRPPPVFTSRRPSSPASLRKGWKSIASLSMSGPAPFGR